MLSLSKYDLDNKGLFSHIDLPLRGMKATVKYHIPLWGMKAIVEYHKPSVAVVGSKNSFSATCYSTLFQVIS